LKSGSFAIAAQSAGVGDLVFQSWALTPAINPATKATLTNARAQLCVI
jgi:hypothetical protein